LLEKTNNKLLEKTNNSSLLIDLSKKCQVNINYERSVLLSSALTLWENCYHHQ